MTYRYPQLVRVLWTCPRSKKRKSVFATRLARNVDEAFEIANALEFCMVPVDARRLVYQVAVLGRRATARDALQIDTQWATFFREGANLLGRAHEPAQ